MATLLLFAAISKCQNVNKASAPLPPSNRTNQRLQHQALYGVEPLDWLIRRAYTNSPWKLATQRDEMQLLLTCNHCCQLGAQIGLSILPCTFIKSLASWSSFRPRRGIYPIAHPSHAGSCLADQHHQMRRAGLLDIRQMLHKSSRRR